MIMSDDKKSISTCPVCNSKMIAISETNDDGLELLSHFYCENCDKKYYINIE